MKLIPTFIDGDFRGYNTLKEITQLRNEGYKMASLQQKEKQADHMVYCHYDLDEEGNIKTAWFYSGLAMNEASFDNVSKMPKAFIGAIHKH